MLYLVSMSSSARRLMLVALLMLLVGTACAQSAAESEVDDPEDAGGVPPISMGELATEVTAKAMEGCVKQRSGFDLSDRARVYAELRAGRESAPVPFYSIIELACFVSDGGEVPETWRESMLVDNGSVGSLADCVVSEHSWTRSENVYDGVGGAIAPDVGDAQKRNALLDCGFEDTDSLDDEPFANIWPFANG